MARTESRSGRGVEAPVRLLLVVGAATPPGRLARAIEALAEAVVRGTSGQVAVDLMNLADARPAICDGRPDDAYDEATRAVVRRVASADCVILASPVYRASITGVLKNLLDLVPLDALHDKPVGIVAMGGSLHHYLGVDGHLRQVLAWFGAVVAPTSVYLTPSDFDAGVPTPAATGRLEELATTVVRLARALRGGQLGPAPLAASGR